MLPDAIKYLNGTAEGIEDDDEVNQDELDEEDEDDDPEAEIDLEDEDEPVGKRRKVNGR